MATSSNKKYAQDGDEAKEIAQYLPYFPFKGIPRFYDIGAFLYGACVTQLFLAGTFIFNLFRLIYFAFAFTLTHQVLLLLLSCVKNRISSKRW